MIRWSCFRNCRSFRLFSFFKTGDSGNNKGAGTEQIRQAGISVYQRVEARHGDSDTGGSLGSSLRIGGSNDDAHWQAAHRLFKPPPRLAGTLHAGSAVALS